MRVAFVTTSMGGAGHLSRAIAIGRAIRRDAKPWQWRVFGPAHQYPSSEDAPYVVAPIAREEMLDVGSSLKSTLARELAAYAPDVVLVDMFWAPIVYIARSMAPVPFWLLLRNVPATWLRGPAMNPFRPGDWRRIIAIEPQVRVEHGERTCPVVGFNPDETMPPPALARHLGLDDKTPITVVTQTGEPGEIELLPAAAAGHHVLRASLHSTDQTLFPLAPWLTGATHIIAGAGYNLFWETRWLGLHDRCTFHAFARSIDDQKRRLLSRDAPMNENGADTLVQMLARG